MSGEGKRREVLCNCSQQRGFMQASSATAERLGLRVGEAVGSRLSRYSGLLLRGLEGEGSRDERVHGTNFRRPRVEGSVRGGRHTLLLLLLLR